MSLTRAPAGIDVGNPNSSREKGLQIVSVSPFKLPDDWFVEERPRFSNPSHIDRYYYEPGTGKKFRSLVAVQRYLTGESRNCVPAQRMISENEHTTFTESGTGQRFSSLKAVDSFLTGEDAHTGTATPKVLKLVVKSGTGKRSAHGVKSCRKPVNKRSNVAEDKNTLKALKHSIQSTPPKETVSQKKINLEEEVRGSIHNLSRPPAKVSWVLSGPGGFWSPLLDDSIVSESEKLKWSEAFVLSIHDGVINGLNS